MTLRWWRSWRPALRAARRDVLRHKGRNTLVLALVALPMLAVTCALVLVRSDQLGPEEEAERAMGAADARLWPRGERTPLVQDPTDPHQASWEESRSSTPLRPWTPDELLALLPDGARVIPYTHGSALVRTDAGYLSAEAYGLDLTDPMARGAVGLVQGRAPEGDTEVAVSQAVVDRGYGIGTNLSVGRNGRELTVVGVIRLPDALDANALLTQPGALPTSESRDSADVTLIPEGRTWLVDLPGGMSWKDVKQVNTHGVAVLSRALLLDPPPPSAVPKELSGDTASHEDAAVVGLVVACGLLEVVLLAGAAFAVGTRRQHRALALVAAAGGGRRDVRRIVLAQGVVLGGLGSVIGVALGVAVAAVSRGPLEGLVNHELGHFDVRVLDLVAVVALGTTTGLLAAIVPAATAARQDVVAALRGHGLVTTCRRGRSTRRFGWSGLGALMAAAGTLLVVVAAARRSEWYLVVGAVVAQLGLVLSAPVLVGAAGRVAAWLPLSSRIAVRDAARHRARSAPAVAAVMVAVAGVVALATGAASDFAERRAEHQPVAPYGDAVLYAGGAPALADDLEATVRRTLPDASTVPLRHLEFTECQDGSTCPWLEIRAPGCQPDAPADAPQCPADGEGYSFLVGDGDTVQAVAGQRHPDAEAVLRRGGVVMIGSRWLDGHQVTLAKSVDDGSGQARASTTWRLPATVVPGQGSQVWAVVSPALAHTVGAAAPVREVAVSAPGGITPEEERKVGEALRFVTADVAFNVERGFDQSMALPYLALAGVAGLVMLAGTAIAGGLALADARPDHATMAAVGAAPSVRRRAAAAQAGTIAVLGVLLGLPAGLVPGVASAWPLTGDSWSPSGTGHEVHVALPWPVLAAVAVVIPLVAVLGAALFTRSRLPMVQRIS